MKQYDYDRMWEDVYGDIQEHGPGHHHLTRIVRRILSEIEYDSVLDVGCGLGHNHRLLTKGGQVARFDGIDVSEKALEWARAHAKGHFRQCDIQRECPEGTWELVSCSLVLEHLADDDAAIRNLRKVAGHYLLITSIAGDSERYRAWEETQGHVRNYRVGQLEQKLCAEGFQIQKVIYWGFPFYSPIARTLQTFSKVGVGEFGIVARIIAGLLTGIYYLNSHRRGDVVIVLAEV